MLAIHFLAAADGTRLTKQISTTHTQSYPNVLHFTSHSQEAQSLSSLAALLQDHAVQGHVLLKGQLQRPLVSEPRRGATRSDTPTGFLCLDVDGAQYPSPEAFIHDVLPGEFHDVGYVLHWSASSGIKPNLRCHLFFLLASPLPPPVLREWLVHLNLNHAGLNAQLALAASSVALLYPLDVSTCQNDKLIYIAPPILDGIEDPHPTRFELVTKSSERVAMDLSRVDPAANDALKAARINELREAKGLKAQTPRPRTTKHVVYESAPSRATVTGVDRGERYTRLNLNGGDSWAYYHFTDRPLYLYNFKDEPIYRLQDIVPDYWGQLAVDQHKPNDATNPSETTPVVFRDFRTDTYYNGVFHPKQNELQLAKVASKDRMSDFLAQFGMELPDPVQDWDYRFDPTQNVPIDFPTRFCNKYRPTHYVRHATQVEDTRLRSHCPTIEHILRSVTADEKSYDHFMHWLAFVYQRRERPQTAWIFHGVQGTGKGLLFHNVLLPTLGPDHCKIVQIEDFEDKHNEWMETCLLMFVDEVHADRRNRHLLKTIMNLITEPHQRIRAMRTDAYQVPSYLALMFGSNDYDAMEIDPTDRRFFVANRQETMLRMTDAMVDGISDELQAFVNVMMSIEIDEAKVRRVYMSEAKATMRASGQNSAEMFFENLLTGHLDYFLELVAEPPPFHQEMEYNACRKVLDRLLKEVKEPIFYNDKTAAPEQLVTAADIRALYDYIQGSQKQLSPNMFSRLLRHNNVILRTFREEEDQFQRGVRLTLRASEEAVLIYRSQRKVVPFHAVARGLPET